MENLLTKRNIIIAGVVIVILLSVLIFSGLRRDEIEEKGFFGTLFPEVAERLGIGEKAPPPAGQETPEGFVFQESDLPLGSEESRGLPVGALIRLSNSNISSLTSHFQSVRYHKNIAESLGHLFERKADGTDDEQKISNFTIPQILRIVWAPDGNRAVIFYTLENEIRKLLIDYSTSTPRTNFLPESVSDAAFSPDSKSLAFVNNLGGTQNVFVATSDFRNPRRVFENNIPGFEIAWVAPNTMALKTKSSHLATGFLYTVDIKSGALTKIAEGLGLDAVWSADGSGVLYSTVNAGGGILPLQFYNVKSKATTKIDVRTMAEKCVFLNMVKNAVYCAVPANTQGVRFPDEWWQGKATLSDDFVVIDTSSGQTTAFVAAPGDVVQPKALANDSWLLFREKSTGSLWSLKLK